MEMVLCLKERIGLRINGKILLASHLHQAAIIFVEYLVLNAYYNTLTYSNFVKVMTVNY